MLQFSEATIAEFYRDPVMAAAVLLGWELDKYQAVGLRYDWWYPETIDDSAVGTGKTLRIFILACLRCVLIPDQQVGVYFPAFQVAQDEFWPYFAKTIGKSDFFASQLRWHHGKLGESKPPGAWIMDFKDSSRILVPAPGHGTDGANQAGRSFNTLIVDDWRRCEEKGDAIAKQLIDRVRRPCFNQHHPIWGNHTHFKGHAEGPGHKSHRRVQRFKSAIKEGSTRHAIYTFCYRDVSKAWVKMIRHDQVIKSQRVNLTADRFQCQLLGLSARSGSSYYPEATLEKCRVAFLVPMLRREDTAVVNETVGDLEAGRCASEAFVLGFDVAPGQTIKADYSSAFIDRVRKADGALIKPTWGHDLFGAWEISAVFAHTLRNKSAGETSAFIHYLHERFAFSSIVLDPGGGGLWVYKELRKPAQTYVEQGWIERRVLPLCTGDEQASMDKQPIVTFFKRGERFDKLSFVHRNCLVSDDGFLFAIHQRYQEAWHGREILYPQSLAERAPEVVRPWTPDMITAQKTLDQGLVQLSKVRQLTNSEGEPAVSRRGFPMFKAQGKKDIAYSGLFAFAGVMAWVENHASAVEMEADSMFYCG